jgi:probable non-F420 flavinoid oxidoreductase
VTVTVGYHASHEQFAPSRLLATVQLAEQAGFDGIMASDHLMPWGARQGQSGYVWSWLGAAMHATSLPFGVVSAPGQRYHPVILAQAMATITELFPDRLWVALGSGENLNEHVTGDPWPVKRVRNERLRECVDIMRALLAGETVEHDGLVRAKQARLYVDIEDPPAFIGAAVSVETAGWVGSWADGMVTINQPHDHLRRMIAAFRAGGGEAKPMAIQVHVSWAPTDDEALAAAHDQWATNVFPSALAWNLETPEQFDAAAERVRPEDMCEAVVVTSDASRLANTLRSYLDLGFSSLYVHQVGPDQERFIEAFSRDVLPDLRS